MKKTSCSQSFAPALAKAGCTNESTTMFWKIISFALSPTTKIGSERTPRRKPINLAMGRILPASLS